jgi:hypothetical protein
MPMPMPRSTPTLTALVLALLLPIALSAADPPIQIGDRLEPFVDRHLIESTDGVTLTLGQPRPEEIVLTFDNPWEGGASAAYPTVIKDGKAFRRYYRGGARAADGLFKSNTEITCYAESADGITWVKPKLGLVPFEGSTDNNIILAPDRRGFSHNFTAMLDDRPGVPPAERYKGVGAGSRGEVGLLRFVSPDGIHWKIYSDEVIFPGYKLDSCNVLSWLPAENCYAIYMRAWSVGGTPDVPKPRDAYRTIARATSQDFKQWSTPERMQFTGDAKPTNLYTNATAPYFRAPHIMIGLPHRVVSEEVVPRSELESYGVSLRAIGVSIGDVMLLTSRGGTTYDRTFMEGFVRPGPERGAWHARSLFASMGIVPTSDSEMSFYVSTNYMLPSHHIRRYSLRTDGIASLRAPLAGGTVTTKPVVFSGGKLLLNDWTSAAGSIRVELLSESGQPLPGYGMKDGKPIIGNELAREVTWAGDRNASELVGTPVKLRFRIADADLYSLRFGR